MEKDIIAGAWAKTFKAKDRRTIYDWAADGKLTLPTALFPTAHFSCATSRHFIPIFDALQDEFCREVNILKPIRGGGTLIGDVWLPWALANEPGPFRYVAQTDQMAKEHAEIRTMPILKSVEALAALIPTGIDRHKDRAQEIIFNNGVPLYIGGPGLNVMQNKGYRYIIADEPWLYKKGTLAEIKGRLGDFLKLHLSKVLFISQGGEEGDDWDYQFHSGELNEWTIQCQKCEHYMQPIWTAQRPDGTRWGIVYDSVKDDNGLYILSKVLPTVRFECEKCAHPHIDNQKTKLEWNRTGKYQVIGEENRKLKSFHWPAIIDFPWDELVSLWLNARNAWRQGRDVTPTVQFWQKRMAEFKSARTAQEMLGTFKREAYSITEAPKNEVARFLTGDRQEEDLFWVQIRNWIVEDQNVETRRLFFGKCYSFEEVELKRKEFNVPANRCLMDSGYHSKGDHGVYAACIKYGWIALKGVGVFSFTHNVKVGKILKRVLRTYAPLSYGDSETSLGSCKLIRFSAQSMSDRVQGLMDAGKWIEPVADENDPLEKVYRKQMAAEQQVPHKNKYGQVEMIWETLSKENHAWDLGKEQCLAAILSKIIPDPFQQETKDDARPATD